MKEHALDLVAAFGLLLLAAGIWLVYSLGWALIALGAGLYGSAVLIALKGSESDATEQAVESPESDAGTQGRERNEH